MIESVTSTWRAAVLDLDHGIGVAVEVPHWCDCAACITTWWEDRTSWEGDLLAFDVVPVALLPDEPDRLPLMLLGTCAAWDENGDEVALWTPDALPVHELGADAVQEHPALPSLWGSLEDLVQLLDLETDQTS
ncbi:MAG: hypothetical protein ACTH6N_14075 [Brachybacterium tyrofermentans]|uniref:hypothetical protein n=1 Tax=Brachybacterium tyrofermentans TaxID=47848 RepID=UPI0018672DB4|nr:hypothetical protein [Brachybacterium tyrofermentans]